jgi:hypothetical protein
VAAIPTSFLLPDSQVCVNADPFENKSLVHVIIRKFHIHGAPGFWIMTWEILDCSSIMSSAISAKSCSLVQEAIAKPFAVLLGSAN